MEENKVFVPKPPKELRRQNPEPEAIAVQKVEQDSFTEQQPSTEVSVATTPAKAKVKINWDLLINCFGLSVSIAAMIVFVFLLAR